MPEPDEAGVSGTAIAHVDEDYDLVAEVTPDRLEDLLRPLDAVSDEFVLEFTDGNLRAAGTGPANVIMVEVEAPATYFESIDADDTEIGIRVPRLLDYLEFVDDTISMAFQADDQQLDLSAGSYQFEYATMDPDVIKFADSVDLDLDAEFELNSDQFRAAAEYAGLCGSHCQFGYDPDRERFTVTDEGDTDTAVFEFSNDEIEVVESHPVNSLYSLDYTQKMADAIPKSTELTLRADEEYPMEVSYVLARDAEGETASVTVRQAPRVRA